MATIGTGGEHPQNTSRDLDRQLQRRGVFGDVELYDVTLLAKTLAGDLTEVTAHMILPHEICWLLFQRSQLGRLTGDSHSLTTYWDQVKDQAWLKAHPYCEAIMQDTSHSIPLRLWGDEAAVTKAKKLYCIEFSSVVCLREASMLSRFLSVAVPSGAFVCLDPLYEVLAWSLGILAKGVLPSERHDNIAFSPKSKRAHIGGQSVMGAFRAYLSEFAGDLEFHVRTFKFEHFNSKEAFCFECCATKQVSEISGYEFSRNCGWAITRRLHYLYMLFIGDSLAVTKLPGFHLDIVCMDFMHCVHLGVLHYVIGSSLFVLLRDNYFQGPASGSWQRRFSKQLQVAWYRFKTFLRSHKLCTGQGPFCISRLSLQALSDPPIWKGKAGDNALVLRWLLHEYLKYSRSTKQPEHEAIASCLWGWTRAIDICSNAGMFFSDAELPQLEEARCAALFSDASLAHKSIAEGSQLWRTIPKFHYSDHLLRPDWPEGGRRNPAHGWCFQDEDFIGRIVRSSRGRIHLIRILRKYLLRFSLMLDRGSSSVPGL